MPPKLRPVSQEWREKQRRNKRRKERRCRVSGDCAQRVVRETETALAQARKRALKALHEQDGVTFRMEMPEVSRLYALSKQSGTSP